MTDSHANVYSNKNVSNQVTSGEVIKGPDLNEDLTLEDILATYGNIGFQATNLSNAIKTIKEMLNYRLINDEEILSDDSLEFSSWSDEVKRKTGCRIFLSCTSNVISSGMRELVRYLVEHKLIDVLVMSAGGIEEDIIKCLGEFYVGDFDLDGKELRQKETNRIGNILVPNQRYEAFEDFVLPILDECVQIQQKGFHWTPSRLIWKLGKKINSDESVLFWAQRNGIPVFCPALTDGALGDCLYFHSFQSPGLILDIVGDIRSINSLTTHSPRNGVVVLGGGSPKHHIMNACLFSRSGADWAVYVNCGLEAEGSDSGAPPSEAVAWGKIAPHAKPVKVFAELSLVFPILVFAAFKSVFKENSEFYHSKRYESPFLYWREMEDDVGISVEWI